MRGAEHAVHAQRRRVDVRARGGRPRPATRCRPSRSTSTSIVIGPGRNRREEDRVRGHERELVAAERLLHRAQRRVHRHAAEDVHDLPRVGNVGVESARRGRDRACSAVSARRSRGIGEPTLSPHGTSLAAAARATSGTTSTPMPCSARARSTSSRRFAHHPKLMKRWLVFGNHVLAKSTLPAARSRAPRSCAPVGTAARRTSGRSTSRSAARSGITDDEIARVADGPDAAGLVRTTTRCSCARPTSCTTTRR